MSQLEAGKTDSQLSRASSSPCAETAARKDPEASFRGFPSFSDAFFRSKRSMVLDTLDERVAGRTDGVE